MELMKAKDNLTYVINDVTFIVRSQATVRDKLEIDLLGDFKDGKFTVQRSEIYLKIIELFVCGWKGVTEDGKDVPYSFDALMNRLPYDIGHDWLLKLGAFIWDTLHLYAPAETPEKNA